MYKCLLNQITSSHEYLSPANNPLPSICYAQTLHHFVFAGIDIILSDVQDSSHERLLCSFSATRKCRTKWIRYLYYEETTKTTILSVQSLPIPSFLSESDLTMPSRQEINSITSLITKRSTLIKKQLVISHFYTEKSPSIPPKVMNQENSIAMPASQSPPCIQMIPQLLLF